MEKIYRLRHNIKAAVCAIITVVLLCLAISSTVTHVYTSAEDESYEKLHLETQQIKRDINLQVYSDRENLITMANFASKLYEDGEDFSLLFKSFQEIGLFEDVRILKQDNGFVTKLGAIPGVEDLDFNEEVKKGTYISGRVVDLVNRNKEVVRSAVPIKDDNGNTIAIIYGIVDLQKFEDRYLDDVRSIGADLFIIDQNSGNFIIDTKRDGFGNVTELSKTTFEDGYSFDGLASELASGEDGFVSFDSIVTGAKLYAHYAPLEFADWEIMVAKPADEVFSNARATGSYMVVMAIILIMIMLIYVIVVFISERNNLNINTNASIIRKRLLEVNQDQTKIADALKLLTEYANARSASFIDSYRENHYYISPTVKKSLLSEADREYLINEILSYISKSKNKPGVSVYITKLKTDKNMKADMPSLYRFFVQHEIKRIDIASISNNSVNTSVLFVVNAKQRSIGDLLKDISVCFSMTVHNKRYLTRTESMALTDALTGVSNRMAYKQDIKEFSEKVSDRFTCIYIDVNELNYYNNKYGHAAGDQMLIFIAETLGNEFRDGHLYRMGGDEFLIFVEDVTRDEIINRINRANSLIEEMKYHISIGIKKKMPDMTLEELVNEAEKRMYLEKTKYYQNKNDNVSASKNYGETKILKTGLKEIDACLGILQSKCYGIYYVSFDSDTANQVLSPTYFDIEDNNNKFSDTLKRYIHDYVSTEYQRILLNFIQYDLLIQQLSAGEIPKIRYTKKDGSNVVLSVWAISSGNSNSADAMWIFEKE